MSDLFFIGVDGGGTHSKAVLMDENFLIIRRACGDCLNYYSIDESVAKRHFRELICQLIPDNDLCKVRGVFIGMSALDHEETPERTMEFTQGLFSNADVVMDSDLYVALMGYTLGKPGIMAVSGTGAMAIALDSQSQIHVSGGYGHLLGDQGSAYTIAMDAIRACLLAFDGIEPPTLMQSRLISHFELTNHREIIDKVYSSTNPKKLLSSFSVEVSAAAVQGDQRAAEILKQNGHSLAAMACALIRQAKLEHIGRIGIYGSVLLNDAIVRDSFKQYMQASNPHIIIEVPKNPPEVGAAIAALCRCMPDKCIQDNRIFS